MFLNNELIGIVRLSLYVSITATLISSIGGILLAVPIALKDFKMKKYLIRVISTLMSIPPVLMGLITYLLLSRKGPLGYLGLLFTPTAMIISQTLLIFPIVLGLTISMIESSGKRIKQNCYVLGASPKDIFFISINECKRQMFSIVAAGFGRAISEVGAVMIVGGNIKGKTRVMTTYISLEIGQGNFNEAIIIGIILLSISFIINFILHSFGDKKAEDEVI